MDDIASAVAAAAAAAAAGAASQPATEPAPPSPQVKQEIKRESSPAEPVHKTSTPPSPLKRPRSPAHDEVEQGDEKRLKKEDETNFDELTRMIEQAQESANTQIPHQSQTEQPNGQVSDHEATSGAGDQFTEDIVNGIMASLGSGINNDLSGVESSDIRMDDGIDGFVPQESGSRPPAKSTLWNDPVRYTRRAHALPALRSAAVDVLKALSDNPFEDTWATLNDQPESDISKEYATLKSFFDILRKYFSSSVPLLYADNLDITSSEEREIIRIANLATSCASMFGTNEITLEDLNRDFLGIFVPRDQNMPSDVAELYLGLKTQMFLILLESEPQNREQVLEELFVSGIEDALKRHHPSLPLTVNETSFLENAKARKAMLLNESKGPDNIQALYQQFRYEPYLDSLGTYLNDNMAAIEVAGTIESNAPTAADNAVPSSSMDTDFDLSAIIAEASKAAQDAVHGGAEYANNLKQASVYPSANTPAVRQPTSTPATNITHQPDLTSAAESASRFSQLAIQSIQQNQYRPAAPSQATAQPVHTQGPPIYPAQQQQANSQQQYYRYPQQPPPTNIQQQSYQTPSNENLPPNQSETTSVLYERARQAAAARSSTHARREGSHSTRRPWAPEEERALMMGLDMVKGPHWSQILSLFGPNGTISNILADRTQVQLKDKARNLKLFFLKTNSEMPYYLQCVTGELKTRAPSQAARKEAEERARMNSEEEQARINGIMTLGNMQQNGVAQGPRPNGSVASAPNGAPGQQMPHAHPGSQQGTPGVTYPQAAQPTRAPASSTTSGVQNAQNMHLAQATARPQAGQGQPPGQPQVQTQAQPQMQPQPRTQTPVQLQSQSQSQPQAQNQPQSQPESQPQLQQQQQQSSRLQSQLQRQQYQKMQQQQPPQARPEKPPQYPQQAQPTPEATIKKQEPNAFQGLNPEETALLEIKRALEREKAEQAQAQAQGQLARNGNGAVPSTTQA